KGAVGLGKVDAPQPDRGARSRDIRRRDGRRREARRPRGRRADARAPRQDRLHLSVLQPAADAHEPREREHAPASPRLAPPEGGRARPQGADARAARPPHDAPARRALRGRAPARGDRARAVDLSADPARRRTDGQPRHAHRRRDPRTDPRRSRAARIDGRHRHARHERRRELRAHDRAARRPRRGGQAAMILLRLISWPYFRRHVLRTALTAAGIVLGVAVFVGMHTANQSVLFAFSHTVDRIAGKTELQVTAGETGFDEEVLDTVQGASTVRVAVPVIEAVVDSRVKGEGNLLVLGIDMTGDRSLRDYDLESGDDAVIDDPLVFLAQPDSIILSNEFAQKTGIATGGTVTLGTARGDRAFTVRGVMKSTGLTSAFGGNLAIMDIYAAQRMFGRGRKFDRIDLAVRDGRTIAEAEHELGTRLGPGFQVEPPSGRGQQ